VLKTLDKNAVFIACGDAPYNAITYAREIEGKRPDVLVVQRDILRAWIPSDPNWTSRYYYDHVAQCCPDMQRSHWRSAYSLAEVQREKLLYDFITAVIAKRPVYIACTGNDYLTHPILKRLKDGFKLVPEGIVFRILPAAETVDTASLVKQNDRLWRSYRLRRIYDGSIRGGRLEREIPARYAAFHIALGNLELSARMYGRAAANFRKALQISGKLDTARDGLGIALACQGRYREAASEWQTVLLTNPCDPTARRGLKLIAQARLARPGS